LKHRLFSSRGSFWYHVIVIRIRMVKLKDGILLRVSAFRSTSPVYARIYHLRLPALMIESVICKSCIFLNKLLSPCSLTALAWLHFFFIWGFSPTPLHWSRGLCDIPGSSPGGQAATGLFAWLHLYWNLRNERANI
jgi:hypothetical protein